jgi:hypothetical protein
MHALITVSYSQQDYYITRNLHYFRKFMFLNLYCCQLEEFLKYAVKITA